MTFLEVRNLSVHAGATAVVRDASLRMEELQTYTLLGETGSGKSLLAQAIMENLPEGLRTSGSITVFGETSAVDETVKRRRLWGHSLALLPQEPWLALDPAMRVLFPVAETYQQVHRPSASRESARERATEDFLSLGLTGAERKLPGALSGGMAQRTAFAAVRAGGARLLIVDEPTKGLDAGLRDRVVSMLKQVTGDGGAVLAITHDVAAARLLGGTSGVMLDGEIVEQGPADQVLKHPAHDYTRRLLAADPQAWSPRTHPSPGGPLLTATGLSKRFGNHQLFTNLGIEIASGERVAVIGPGGSGKTTLGSILMGLLPPDSGSVSRRPGIPAWKYQKLYQDPIAAFAPHVRLRTSLLDVVFRHKLGWQEVEKWMDRTRLRASLLDRLPGQVSSGELQRIALVRVLLLRPVLLVADEPASRLDPITQQETIGLLAQCLADSGCALVPVTHDPAIAGNLALRVLTLNPPSSFAQ
jgi:peptide/nickel transport system ATP-binding protein